MGMSITHWLIVVVVITLLFGRNMISGLLADAGKGIANFRKAMTEAETPPRIEDHRDVR